MAIPEKYKHINFVPPESVAKAAERGLEYRKKNKGRGGLSAQQAKEEGVGSGVQRAVNLKNRNQLNPETVRRMKAFFDRHQKNKKVEKGKQPWEDKGMVSHLLWGGDPGYAWAKKICEQMDAADAKEKQKKSFDILNKLVKLANKLDEKHFFEFANIIDDLIKTGRFFK